MKYKIFLNINVHVWILIFLLSVVPKINVSACWEEDLEDFCAENGIEYNEYDNLNVFLANADDNVIDDFFDGAITYSHDEDGNIVGTIDEVEIVGTRPSTDSNTDDTSLTNWENEDPCNLAGADPCECWGICDDPSTNEENKDCAGIVNGSAYTDKCGNCVGGTTGKDPCKCPCLKNLTQNAHQGLLLNLDGVIIYHGLNPGESLNVPDFGSVNGSMDGFGTIAGTAMLQAADPVTGAVQIDLYYNNRIAYLADGTPIVVEVMDGISFNNEPLVYSSPDYGYNCIGYALTGGQFGIDASQEGTINAILGINSFSEINQDDNCTGIQKGDILVMTYITKDELLYNNPEVGPYKHMAVYVGTDDNGNKLFDTKNGYIAPLQRMTLDQIKQLYGPDAGYIRAPKNLPTDSSLGNGNYGQTTKAAMDAAKSTNCDCNQ